MCIKIDVMLTGFGCRREAAIAALVSGSAREVIFKEIRKLCYAFNNLHNLGPSISGH